MKFLSKKNGFLLSLFFVGVVACLIVIQETCDYDALGWCWKNWTEIGLIGQIIFWPSILTFFFSLLTLPLTPAIFEAWKRFAVWAVPVMLVVTTLLILGGEGNAYFSFGLGPFILMILYGLYVLISLTIIAWKYFATRKLSK